MTKRSPSSRPSAVSALRVKAFGLEVEPQPRASGDFTSSLNTVQNIGRLVRVSGGDETHQIDHGLSACLFRIRAHAKKGLLFGDGAQPQPGGRRGDGPRVMDQPLEWRKPGKMGLDRQRSFSLWRHFRYATRPGV